MFDFFEKFKSENAKLAVDGGLHIAHTPTIVYVEDGERKYYVRGNVYQKKDGFYYANAQKEVTADELFNMDCMVVDRNDGFFNKMARFMESSERKEAYLEYEAVRNLVSLRSSLPKEEFTDEQYIELRHDVYLAVSMAMAANKNSIGEQSKYALIAHDKDGNFMVKTSDLDYEEFKKQLAEKELTLISSEFDSPIDKKAERIENEKDTGEEMSH